MGDITSDRNRIFQQRLQQARRSQPQGTLLFDPIEEDVEHAEALASAEALADQELARMSQTRGFCHLYWQTKQRILKEKFGLTWFSPSEMNPSVRFD